MPKWRASVCAVTQPTSGMLRPKSTRENGISFDASIAAIALPALISREAVELHQLLRVSR